MKEVRWIRCLKCRGVIDLNKGVFVRAMRTLVNATFKEVKGEQIIYIKPCGKDVKGYQHKKCY